MNRKNNTIFTKNIISEYHNSILKFSSSWSDDYNKLQDYIENIYNINSSIDQDIISSFATDWSNMSGNASILFRPIDIKQCAIVMKICYQCKIPLTISAGRTNLTGSATANGGAILSTLLLTSPSVSIDDNLMEAKVPTGMPFEQFRNEVLQLSKKKLYYPVNPTSRHEALVGGTVACNASGFIPGEKGATRYWVKGLDFLLPNGDMIKAKRGDYLSENGFFNIQNNNKKITIPVPKYKRPKIKNASGPYSCYDNEIDLIDFIVGSEGIYGLVTNCILGLKLCPKNYLKLFISLRNESLVIDFHDYLFKYFNGDMSRVSALEYFGHNSQNYMKNREYLFSNPDDVGIYLEIPIYNSTIEKKADKWMKLISDFNEKIDLNNIIVLNEELAWRNFFEARHSIPDNALTKTKQLGGISIITDTIVPPENFSEYLSKIHMTLRNNNIEYLLFGHLGDCHLHFHLIPSVKQDGKCLEIYDYMIDLSSDLGGVYSAEHGTGKRKRDDFTKCYGNEAVNMVKEAKRSVDPYFILNRGNVFK